MDAKINKNVAPKIRKLALQVGISGSDGTQAVRI